MSHTCSTDKLPDQSGYPDRANLPNSWHFIINQLLWSIYLMLQLLCS